MVGQLITLPMRLSLRAAQTFVRAGVSLSARVLALVSEEAPAPDTRQPDRGQGRGPAPMPAPRPVSPPPRPEPEPEPTHVSEEPVLVQQLAEPGAEDGAGANIVIGEPWKGYGQMTARDVIARLRGSDSAALAAVHLYESSNRGRRTVLSAVRRELASKNGST